jgi:mono/diheme cytochrome c family protein
MKSSASEALTLGSTSSLETGDVEGGFRARSERGLEISPVPLQTSELTNEQRMRVGLGSYIVNGTADCGGCHSSPAGFLSGGNPFFLDRAGHVVWSRNLTPDASTGMALTEAQFFEVMRTGKDFHRDQVKMLVVMPWLIFRWMSDEDLKAIYAYLRALPPVHNVVPPDNKSDLPVPGSIPFPKLYNDGEVDRRLPHEQGSFSAQRGLAIAPRAQPQGLEDDDLQSYGLGSYMANSMTACNECHTNPDRTPDSRKINTAAYLSGGNVFGVPPPLQPLFHQVRTTTANLKGATHGFFNEPGDSYTRFRQIIRTQSHADESPPRPVGFPMNLIAGNLAKVLEHDLKSIYTYVKGVPPVTGPNDQPRQAYARFCSTAADCHAGESCSAATHECVGKACTADVECDTCQTCNAGTCAAPAADSACVASAR